MNTPPRNLKATISPKSWPRDVVMALPQLLVMMLEQNHCQSLERLQLVSITVDVLGANQTGDMKILKNPCLVRNGEFLELRGELAAAEDAPTLRIVIRYFLRGQRKFFRHRDETRGAAEQFLVEPIGQQDVIDFFGNLGLPQNSAWLDEDIAKLNGKKKPTLPNELIIAFLLEQAMERGFGPCFHLNFFRSVQVLEPLTLEVRHAAHDRYLLLKDDTGEPIAGL